MKHLFIALAALALTGCATPADAAHCRGTNGRFIKCPAPPPPTQTCPDGTIILATAVCPTPIPPVSSACPSLANPAWANGGAMTYTDEICTATKVCSSVWRNSLSDAKGISFPATIIGAQYYVSPLVNGLLPAGFAGKAVVAAPVSGAGAWSGDWQFDPSCFQ